MYSNRIVALPEDVVTNIILYLDITSVIRFFSTYMELNHILKNKQFLIQLSIYNNIPIITGLTDLSRYSRMHLSEKLQISKYITSYNFFKDSMNIIQLRSATVKRMIDLNDNIGENFLRVKDYEELIVSAIEWKDMDTIKLMLCKGCKNYNK